MHPFPRFALEAKRIPYLPDWTPPDGDTEYTWLEVPLEINGVVEVGLVLHVGCWRYRPNCNVSFEIRVSKRPGRDCIPLARVDWRSLNGGHSNQPRHGTEWAGMRLGDTHNHAFVLNWMPDQGRMKRSNLPVAMPINEHLETFEALRAFFGKETRISNIEVVPPPQWEYKLL